ncbi:ADP-ribose pyrophosphatase YjhB (NUDIX family) [Krasilnikovia cinnamomea]|uniref:ADP-ribose pyrophosphatase YjhB (NUDIX family) n=1 Tax=Krasilnikovia cinnamomea TaxID=349313 RepID=A0A4Q7ZG48_9ACTN|nr:NUDIX hydrolase [Krasilnikovia cinnamomea]RZU49344.1 ADP-ribose pyrophosphatase YjhB (NUDIX family) [Krasilnikovia cinnamomea]
MAEQESVSGQASIAAAIIVHDGKVLLVRRRVSEGTLSWQFPAGKVEPGESDVEAAIRETSEEVGLEVRASRRLGERVHPTTGRTMIYVACDVVGGTARVADADEIAAVEWCDRTKLLQHVPYPLHDPVQRYLDGCLESG